MLFVDFFCIPYSYYGCMEVVMPVCSSCFNVSTLVLQFIQLYVLVSLQFTV